MNIENNIKKANQFINQLETSRGFKLFERSEVSPYARCFVIFTKYLTKQFNWLEKRKQQLIHDVNIDLYAFYKNKISSNIDWKFDKPFLQLFCFTLSSLNILDAKLSDKNLEILNKILNVEVKKILENKNVDKGDAGSGNYSMFFAIFNIYANDYLKIKRDNQIQEWLDFNTNSINSNGFWGHSSKMNYLQFQNGYHQYEIFEYLKFKKAPWNNAAKNVLQMSDKYGHFAPWPGGGSCYDYDAIFMLTSEFVDEIDQENILIKTLHSIVNEQNLDGGFCESLLMDNNSFIKFLNVIKHVSLQPKNVRFWSLYINLNLLRFKHRNIITHWSQTHRRWNESNAWDTFFRLSTIYRICNRLNMEEKSLFQINNFPGIG